MLLQDIINGKGEIFQYSDGYQFKELASLITCKDGTTLSVQASENHYCRPHNNTGPYSHVEVGFPSVDPVEFMEYAEDHENLQDTVYGYVPVELVREFINNHGGENV